MEAQANELTLPGPEDILPRGALEILLSQVIRSLWVGGETLWREHMQDFRERLVTIIDEAFWDYHNETDCDGDLSPELSNSLDNAIDSLCTVLRSCMEWQNR